jgi:isopenicillin-N N-acyltransferase like protein
MNKKFEVVQLIGVASEIGLAHGEMFRNEIKEILDGFTESVLLHSKGRKQTITHYWWREWALRSLPYITDYYPEMVEEIKALAQAANVNMEDVLCLNAFLDIWDWITPDIYQGRFGRAHGCTAFGIPGLINSGNPIIGQNYDLEALFQKGAVLYRIGDNDGKESLVFTIAGIVGCAGMNNLGLAVVINNLTARDARAGVPYPFIIRRLLSSSSIGEAIDSILGAQRSSGMNYIIAHKSGAVISIETSATDYSVLNTHKEPHSHANHYLHDRLIPQEARSLVDRGHSIFRQYRMEHLLKGIEDYGAEKLFEILSDHENNPIGICRHDKPEDTCGKTIASMIFSPKNQKAYLAYGSPCESEYEEYNL